jgi:hypothetical protein
MYELLDGHEKRHQFSTAFNPKEHGIYGGRLARSRLLVGNLQCSFKPEDVIITLHADMERLINAEGSIEDTVPLVTRASSDGDQ